MQRVKNENRKQSGSSESLDKFLATETTGDRRSDSVSAKRSSSISTLSEKANIKAEVAGKATLEDKDDEQAIGLRKKVSKRTASVAALAAISDYPVKDEELEKELLKPLSPRIVHEHSSTTKSQSSSSSQKRPEKAVAIVRPQPQQVISG